MKRYIRSSTGYNISWYTQDGQQSGDYVEVPDGEDAYSYIENYMRDKYGDDFGGIADYISEYDDIDASTITSMTEEEMLDDAILNGRPFDLATFNKYKVDPYRAEGALKASEIQEGDIIEVTEDASEVDYGTQVQIIRIDTSDPDGYGFYDDPVITFEVWDGSSTFNMHFWPNEYVGPKIADGPDYNISLPIQSNVNCSSDKITRYSDVRPYEDRKYWYFTTHGVGPGTIPSDLNVLEVREGQNDKGTWGDFVCLDGVLNTDELSYYDLRELSPDNVMSASDVDDEEDDWSPYYGGIYRVDGGPSYTTIFDNDPVDAIKHWFMAQKSSPSDVAISCETRQQAIELCKAATPELLTKLNDKYPTPYRLDYLIEQAQEQVENGCRSFYENKYGYGDSIHPFSVG